MSDRISIRHLEATVRRLNKLLHRPETYFTEFWKDGVLCRTVNVGHYHISRWTGRGYCLCEVMNEMGGESTPLTMGHIPARDLYQRMQAMITGIELGREFPK